MRPVVVVSAGLVAVLLGGCAAALPSRAPVERVSPECSFESGTTCWTPTGRFPERRTTPPAGPEEPVPPPTLVVAERGASG